MPLRFNIPPVTRILLIVLLLLSFVSGAIRYRQWGLEANVVVPYMVLVPQRSLMYPWTFLTTTLVENNVFTFGIAAVTIFYGGRYLERAWTSSEFAKFLLITSLIPNILCFGILVILFAMTGDMGWTLTMINGTIPLQIAFLIAFSQLVPTHTVTLFKGIVSLRVPRFPLLYIVTIFVLSLTSLLSAASFFQVLSSFMTSWIYLRFYKNAFADLETAQPSSLRGDASETFAFAEFFPEPSRPFMAALGNQVFNILVTLQICTPFSAVDNTSSSREETFVQRVTPGSARAEAERRRALALKALDQRLHAATSGPSKSRSQPAAIAGPSMEMQPQASTQAPASMLGETSYVPDREDEKSGN